MDVTPENEVEAAKLIFLMVGGIIELHGSEFEPSVAKLLVNSMKKHGGADVACATIGWALEIRTRAGRSSITEPWLFPERWAEHGRRWCELNPESERSAAIARLDELHPRPDRREIGFRR